MPLSAPSSIQEQASAACSPLRLPDDLLLTPEQFAAVCQANPDAV
jgi:hypothetical protein